jgi:hypothetical protein
VSSLRKHYRESFFKYMPASTAVIVLGSETLRWSSPTEFNDPYDVPRELASDISSAELQKEISAYMIRAVQEPNEEIGHFLPVLQYIIEEARRATPDTKAEIIKALKDEAAKKTGESRSLDELRDMWRKLIPDFRILCLCESPSSISMWYHYAAKYSGIVLELACSDESDSPWLVAERVEYPEQAPDIFTVRGWAELTMMPVRAAIDHLFHAYAYTKTPDWSYEREWRIASFKRPHEQGPFSDYQVRPTDFRSVYLGPLIAPSAKERIVNLVKERLPHVQLYLMHFGTKRRVEFTPINS